MRHFFAAVTTPMTVIAPIARCKLARKKRGRATAAISRHSRYLASERDGRTLPVPRYLFPVPPYLFHHGGVVQVRMVADRRLLKATIDVPLVGSDSMAERFLFHVTCTISRCGAGSEGVFLREIVGFFVRAAALPVPTWCVVQVRNVACTVRRRLLQAQRATAAP
ncbi:MAG: hypothetical protein AB7I37_16610, partial [Pirellulales bacterium]